MRLMYDSIDPRLIPADATIVQGYIGGKWPTWIGYTDGNGIHVPSVFEQFPNALHVSIAISADLDAMMLDVELYDATPDQAPGWVVRQRLRGIEPTVYMNSSTWPSVRAAFTAQGIREPCYVVAQYDNDPTIPNGAHGKQYQSTPGYDVNSLSDYWPTIDKGLGDSDMTPDEHARLVRVQDDCDNIRSAVMNMLPAVAEMRGEMQNLLKMVQCLTKSETTEPTGV